LIYPRNPWKEKWDFIIVIVLLITCVFTPLNLAFSWHKATNWSNYLNNIIDFFYLCDIIIIFNSAYYENDVDLVEDRKKISLNYLTGWFTIDILSIIPFDMVFKKSEFNKLARVARVGRLYKLVKLTKLIRILKVMKE